MCQRRPRLLGRSCVREAGTALQRRVTLAEVARRAGVSQTTASFVLTGRGDEMRISEQVRVRVEQAVRETGYRPNVVSRSLRTGTTQTIGFVSDTVATTPFAGHLHLGRARRVHVRAITCSSSPRPKATQNWRKR